MDRIEYVSAIQQAAEAQAEAEAEAGRQLTAAETGSAMCAGPAGRGMDVAWRGQAQAGDFEAGQ
jgi:hypothetical protein